MPGSRKELPVSLFAGQRGGGERRGVTRGGGPPSRLLCRRPTFSLNEPSIGGKWGKALAKNSTLAGNAERKALANINKTIVESSSPLLPLIENPFPLGRGAERPYTTLHATRSSKYSATRTSPAVFFLLFFVGLVIHFILHHFSTPEAAGEDALLTLLLVSHEQDASSL